MGMSVFRNARIFYTKIPSFLSTNYVKYTKNFIEAHKNSVELFDGEEVYKISKKLYLMYFRNDFNKQTPHYHIGSPDNKENLYNNGGGKRILFGITDTGININTYYNSMVIPSSSMCMIVFPGSPPCLHQFTGISEKGYGTSLFSYHSGKDVSEFYSIMNDFTVRLNISIPKN